MQTSHERAGKKRDRPPDEARGAHPLGARAPVAVGVASSPPPSDAAHSHVRSFLHSSDGFAAEEELQDGERQAPFASNTDCDDSAPVCCHGDCASKT